jgi:hypothetical protein
MAALKFTKYLLLKIDEYSEDIFYSLEENAKSKVEFRKSIIWKLRV